VFDFFIHFDDKTGDIVSVTNEEFDTEHAVIKASYDEVANFLSGAENFINYKISLKDKTKFKLVKRSQLTNYISTGVCVVSMNTKESPELTIVKNPADEKWTLSLSGSKRDEMDDLDLNFQLIFYVVDGYNLNRVVRRFIVNTVDLVENQTVDVGFEKDSELQPSVVLLTDKFFKYYSMEIVNE
jgi:hypothetical protein